MTRTHQTHSQSSRSASDELPATVGRQRRRSPYWPVTTDDAGTVHELNARQFVNGIVPRPGLRVLLAHVPGRTGGVWLAVATMPNEPAPMPARRLLVLTTLTLAAWATIVLGAWLVGRLL